MQKTWVVSKLKLVLILALLLTCALPVRQAQAGRPRLPGAVSATAPALAPTYALADLLRTDGTLDLPVGRSGSINLAGWQMTGGPGGTPHFTRLTSDNRLPEPSAPQDAMPPAGIPGDNNWDGFAFAGLSNIVNALAFDGAGTLFVGGSFIAAGSERANRIAKWDGTAWTTLGAADYGFNNTVQALAFDSSGNLYAGGQFTRRCTNAACTTTATGFNRLAKWNGATWSTLGAADLGFNNTVFALAFDGSGSLHVGGQFTARCTNPTCSATAAGFNRLAKWNGSAWATLSAADLGLNNIVRALAFDSGGSLLAGGAFTAICTNTACSTSTAGYNRLARWNGSAWATLGAADLGLNNIVYALAFDSGGNLFAGGQFTAICTLSDCSTTTPGYNRLAKWDGSSWNLLGYGLNNIVYALAFDSSGNLYAGGQFTRRCTNAACSTTATGFNRIAKWDGLAWGRLGAADYGFNSTLYALLFNGGGSLHTGGQYTRICNNNGCSTNIAGYNRIASWNGAAWATIGPSSLAFDNDVRAMAFDTSGNLYVGGSFTAAGNLPAGRIAKWDGAVWSRLGAADYGLNNTVFALAIDGSGNLIAGGAFTARCTNLACTTISAGYNRIARWDGSAWHTLLDTVDYGLNNTVFALAIDSSGKLVAGGQFTARCTNTACTTTNSGYNRIAQWNGSAWGTLGAADLGLNNTVYSLVFDSSGNLDAGGQFTALCADSTCSTTTAGNNRIAQWNGSAWGTLGAADLGLNNIVYSLAFDSSGRLHAGGQFTAICTDAACTTSATGYNRIVRWSGSAWNKLSASDYGLNNIVYSLAFDRGGNLYAGGAFTARCTNTACSASSAGFNRLARWDGAAWRTLGLGLNGNAYFLTPEGNGSLYAGGAFDAAGDGAAGRLARWTAADGVCGLAAGNDYSLYTGNLPVALHVDTLGSLDCFSIQRFNQDHPNADPAQETGYYWSLRGLDSLNAAASGFTVTLTLPYDLADSYDRLCRYDTGLSGWECAASSYVAGASVSYTPVTGFSDWAVGDFWPTAVTMGGFEAAPFAGTARLSWETTLELDTLGFNLYRCDTLVQDPQASCARLNPELIPSEAMGQVGGASYTYLDGALLPGQAAYYWLEVVGAEGTQTYPAAPVEGQAGLFLPLVVRGR